MAIRWLSRSTSLGHVEERLTGMTDGIDQVVAFEVYDHPESKVSTRGQHAGQMTGPWLLGDEDECRAHLAELGYEEFDIKATVGIGRARYEAETQPRTETCAGNCHQQIEVDEDDPDFVAFCGSSMCKAYAEAEHLADLYGRI